MAWASLVSKKILFRSFKRSQLAALAATLIDFGTLFTCVEILKIWYVAAVAFGAFLGAIGNFLLSRHWVFHGHFDRAHSHHTWDRQARRYVVVSAGSLLLNTILVWALTESFGLAYGYSKVIIAVLVGVLYNFPMHRTIVFR